MDSLKALSDEIQTWADRMEFSSSARDNLISLLRGFVLETKTGPEVAMSPYLPKDS